MVLGQGRMWSARTFVSLAVSFTPEGKREGKTEDTALELERIRRAILENRL